MGVSRRIQLHTALTKVIGKDPVTKKSRAYFQPPEASKIARPCILYSRSGDKTLYANNKRYQYTKVYTLILVDENPDSEYEQALLDAFDYIKFDRFYVADSLNHWVYSLTF